LCFDPGLTAGAEHPNPNEVSIKVNGQYAVVVQNRLFLGDVILDPGGENEEHTDWFAVSDLEQLDVLPVSSVWSATEREGGPITGIGVSFGAAIIMKRHGLFRFIMDDITDSSTWAFRESKFNRGNMAPYGYAQAGHRIAICAYDGIYLVDANLLAAADETPMIEARISEAINDIYEAMDADIHASEVIAIYDEVETEFIFSFPTKEVWAYNITSKTWRQIDTAHWFSVACHDFDGRALVFNDNAQQLFSTFAPEAVSAGFKTKRFLVSLDRPEVVRYARVKYRSNTELWFNLYVDGDDETVALHRAISESSQLAIAGVPIRKRCNSFVVEIVDSGKSTNPWEFYGMRIEVD
jgi:hypothetical protein